MSVMLMWYPTIFLRGSVASFPVIIAPRGSHNPAQDEREARAVCNQLIDHQWVKDLSH